MTYCTNTDIMAVIPTQTLAQLTDDSEGTTIDISKIDNEIGYADELIDGYLRGRYNLPLSLVPEMIKHISADITVYRLYTRRLELGDVPEAISFKYQEAIKRLKDINRGTLSAGVEDTSAIGDLSLKTNKTSFSKQYNSDMWGTY